MDNALPVRDVFKKDSLYENLSSTLREAFHHIEHEEIVDSLFDLADKNKKWTPIHVVGGMLQDGVRVGITTANSFRSEAGELAKRGLVVVRELGGNDFVVEPTGALVEFLRKHIQH